MLHEQQKKALKAAFPHTVPNLTGFLFLGFAYGIYMHSASLSVVYTFFMASLIYGGSLELLAVLWDFCWVHLLLWKRFFWL